MKRKQGISLIVLVITIIVMIILAASVVITLSNTGIIGKANDAITATDLKNIQQEAEVVKLLEFGNNIVTNGHQARMNKNILIQKLLEHFKGSTQQGDRIITADGKYAIIVTDDLTIIVIPNEKAKKGDLLVNITYDDSSKKSPVKVYVTPTIYVGDLEYSNYYEYAVKILEGVNTQEELEQIFVDGQNYWNEADGWGQPNYKDINELMEYWGIHFCDGTPITSVEQLCEEYGYVNLREFAIDWEFVKPEGYKDPYIVYAEEILERVKTQEELEQIFVEGYNYWNEVDNWGNPVFNNIEELISYVSENFANNEFNTVEGMVEYNGFESLRELAIYWECVKPEEFYKDIQGREPMSYEEYAMDVLKNTTKTYEELFIEGVLHWTELENEEQYIELKRYRNNFNLFVSKYYYLISNGRELSDVSNMEEYRVFLNNSKNTNYATVEEMLIDYRAVEPYAYDLAEGAIVILCSNGERKVVMAGETAEFTINYPGEKTFETISFSGKRVNKKINVDIDTKTFKLIDVENNTDNINNPAFEIVCEYFEGMTWKEWLESEFCTAEEYGYITKGYFEGAVDIYYPRENSEWKFGGTIVELVEENNGEIWYKDRHIIATELIEPKTYCLWAYE